MSPAPKSGTKLAIVLSHPTQYYSPWFRWMRLHSTLEFRVFYLWNFGVTRRHDPNFGASFEWDVDLLSGYDHEFVENVSKDPGAERFFGFNNPGLNGRLAAWRPDVVLLFGYKWASHMRAIAWASLKGIPMIFRGDSHLLGRGAPRLHVLLALRLLYSRFAAFLYVGESNRRYFRAFGVPDRRLFFAPHSVNGELFNAADPRHGIEASELRARLGIQPGVKIVLFAGKFVAAKQPAELLEAFIGLGNADCALVFVGDGPEKDRLQSRASSAGGGRVHFLPFANQSEMPSRYLLADLFVLPSRGSYETWGLAVNEAMHMGIPCLVSDRVGCQLDLVIEDETGWVFDPSNSASLASALAKALRGVSSASRRAEIRGAVARRINGYSYARTTEGLLQALSSISGRVEP